MSSSPGSPFRLELQRNELRFRRVRLVERTWLNPHYVRIRLAGEDLRGFDSPGSDDHLRMFFSASDPGSIDELRAAPNREYTPLRWQDDWLELEFALHGDGTPEAGVAAPWAARAALGSTAGIGGPRGSKVIAGRPDAWFLAGDETSVPAMRRFAWAMDAAATGSILVEVEDPAHELPIEAPDGVSVQYVHRGRAAAGSALAARLDATTAGGRPAGAVFGFVAAEQSVVKPGRALLIDRWGLSPDSIVVRGYWKRGEAEYHAPH